MDFSLKRFELTDYEFDMMAGTNYVVTMIGNRVYFECTSAQLDEIKDYLKSHCGSDYHIRTNSTLLSEDFWDDVQSRYSVWVYFSNPIDRERLAAFLSQYSLNDM